MGHSDNNIKRTSSSTVAVNKIDINANTNVNVGEVDCVECKENEENEKQQTTTIEKKQSDKHPLSEQKIPSNFL